MEPTLNFGDVKAIRVQDIMVKEIVESNIWERPIYFAVTCSEDSKIGLDDYLKMKGMSSQIVPEKRVPGIEFVNEDVLSKQLFTNKVHSNKNYEPGFNFRGLNDPAIFFDDNHRRMSQNYRSAFIRLALYYINVNKKDHAINTLDLMETKMPRNVLKIELGLLYEIGNLYFNAGGVNQYRNIAADVEKEALKKLEENPADVQSYYNPYRILIDTYENLKEYRKLADLWQRIAVLYPNDPNVKANIEKYKNLSAGKNIETDSVPIR